MNVTCPHCGSEFGWGPDAVLLQVVATVPFDEPAPCCGHRIAGRVTRDGAVEWAAAYRKPKP